MTDTIPLVDLHWQHVEIENDLLPRLRDVMGQSAYVLGSVVKEFEAEFAAFSRVRHCIGVANGTDALELALRAAHLEPGSEVLMPANTFIATAYAAMRAGLVPRLVDVDPDHQLMDPVLLDAAITPRTSAVMPVHLFGQMAPLERIEPVCKRNGLVMIEDACQSHGAERLDRPSGSWGYAAGVSFYPGKNLGAYGDAGAVLTMDAEVAESVRLLRNYGSKIKYHHDSVGFNSRLDSLQAAVLSTKLVRLATWNSMRERAADRYTQLLAGVEGVSRPTVMPGNRHVWHLYVVRVHDRDRVEAKMRADGVQVGIHYPIPLHLQPALERLGYQRGDFPVTEGAADEILSLPLYQGIAEDQQQRVIDSLRAALD